MKSTSGKGLKIFRIGILILLLLTFVILYFILKPKQPQVVATPVSLRHIEFTVEPVVTLSVTMGVEVFIKNPNFEPFKYGNTTALVYYRGMVVGEAPIAAGMIQARATQNISTSVELLVNRLVSNPKFLSDATKTGLLNLNSVSRTEGDATVLGILKLHASISVDCYIRVFLKSSTISSVCVSNVKI